MTIIRFGNDSVHLDHVQDFRMAGRYIYFTYRDTTKDFEFPSVKDAEKAYETIFKQLENRTGNTIIHI